jgi:hypothetical protein
VKRALLLCLSLSFVSLSPFAVGCGKHLHGKAELEDTVGRHYLDLRWGRLGNAALRVHPDMREAFVKDWSARTAHMELQELEVVDIAFDPKTDSAQVTLALAWVDKGAMMLHQQTVVQKWIRTDEGWFSSGELNLDGGSAEG